MRATMLGLALGCWATAAVATPAPASPNLLSNPSFDTGLQGWTRVDVPAGATATFESVDAQGSLASGALRTTIPAMPPGGTAFTSHSQCVPATANATYAASLRLRTSNAGGRQPFYVRPYGSTDCSGTGLGIASPTIFPVATTWGGVGAVLTTPVGTRSLKISLQSQTGEGGAAATEEFDDVFLGLAAPSSCVPGAATLCTSLTPGDHRFVVKAIFGSPPRALAGVGTAVSLESVGLGKGGAMWFFAADNPELLVKVLDGCTLDRYFWVFVSAATDVGVELYVGDTANRTWYLFHGTDGAPFPATRDVRAMPCY